MDYIISMTPQQKHIIEKMGSVHRVRIWGEGEKGALVVFSHNETQRFYLSYRIGYRGTADLLSKIKGTEEVNKRFKEMAK